MFFKIALLTICFGFLMNLEAQKKGLPEKSVPATGIAWYTDWPLALKEAKRSKRPILFMAATSQCSGVPGVF